MSSKTGVMYLLLRMPKYFGRLYSRLDSHVSSYKITWQNLKWNDWSSVFQTVPRLTSVMGPSLVVAATSGLGIAHAQGGRTGISMDEHDGPPNWITNRVKNDICHLTPGISELLVDILDLLQESYDKYITSMRRRAVDLESNLRKYGSAISLDMLDTESHSLSDPGSKEITQFRKDYRKTYQRSTEMLSGLDRFLSSAKELGANTCTEKCLRDMKEIRGLLADLEHKVRDYERKLEMAEKHFRTKMRRNVNGSPR